MTLTSGLQTHTFKDLDVTNQDGTPIEYMVEELEVEGYESKINGFEITNTFIEPEKEEKPTLPNTGQSSEYGFMLGGSLLIGLGGYFLLKKKEEEVL